MKYLITLLTIMTFSAVFAQGGEMKPSKYTNCQLIEKAFIKKNGEATEHMELYLRCSMDDYFIKICESKVTRDELMKHLDQGISVKMEIVEGAWDQCPEDSKQVQSRIGTYVVITEIKK